MESNDFGFDTIWLTECLEEDGEKVDVAAEAPERDAKRVPIGPKPPVEDCCD